MKSQRRNKVNEVAIIGRDFSQQFEIFPEMVKMVVGVDIAMINILDGKTLCFSLPLHILAFRLIPAIGLSFAAMINSIWPMCIYIGQYCFVLLSIQPSYL